uniref:Phorbol-ester/DAG-type domain-containing protein n=2 Tax=Brassica campestris TaxID=3711 RepID=A0A3P5ZDR6_BRACM|nr:unnamed protein product [Brassica rapa]
MIRIKLPTHKHPLYPTPWVSRCNGCPRGGGYVKDGYRCYECDFSFHKECAEATLEIHHPSHPAHPLSLVWEWRGPKSCKLCGEYLFHNIYYHCSICDFVVDTACAKNPPPNVIEYPKAHEHSLVIEKDLYHPRCTFCGGGTRDMYYYRCSLCSLNFEIRCSMLALEIDYPYHPQHPLKILTKEEHHFSDGKCLICGEELGLKVYHCSICKFTVDVGCVRDPPPLTILFPKAHEHQLNLTPRKISFDCDACGMAGDRSPYSCQQCYFMIHQSCIDLPEIINVNRHEHRLSRRLHLSPGNWECGFCHKNVDWSYGAYSCSICPNYVIHSQCAIQKNIWDKLELKGIPEESHLEPFKVIDENLICHFSHEEHYLKLNEESIISGEGIRCEACVLPIYYQAFYSCVQCNFILHKTCANLSRKKRHFSHDKALTLICGDKIEHCEMCEKYSQGFKYTDFQYFSIDVECAMLSESIIHESHPCTLYYNNNTYIKCACCNEGGYRSFSCDDCSFGLHGRCAALPKTIQHWYDEHLIFLCYNKNKRGGEYWCDICEEQIDTMIWFYTCDSCCVTFHTKCVLGDFSRFMPGRIVTYRKWRIKAMQTSPETDSKSFPRIEAKHITERSLYLSKMAASPIASPIAVAMYPTLSVFTLAIGLVITAFFFIYEATSSRKNRSLGIELATAALASVFLGFGSLFLLLASGVYV